MIKPDNVTLSATLREPGKKFADQARKNGEVPAVLYGPKVEENKHFTVSELQIEKILADKRRAVVTLKFEDGTSVEAIIHLIDFHPVNDRPNHVDFYVYAEGVPFRTSIPIELVGKSKGVANGGRLIQKARRLNIKTTSDHLPGLIQLDVTKLDIGGTLLVRDLNPEGLEVLDDKQRAIAIVKAARVIKE